MNEYVLCHKKGEKGIYIKDECMLAGRINKQKYDHDGNKD